MKIINSLFQFIANRFTALKNNIGDNWLTISSTGAPFIRWYDADGNIKQTLFDPTTGYYRYQTQTNDGAWDTKFALADYIKTASITNQSTSYGVVYSAKYANGIVNIAISGTPSNLTTGWKVLGTLPALYRPKSNTPYATAVPQTGDFTPFLLAVNTSGELRINPTKATVSSYINCNLIYSVYI